MGNLTRGAGSASVSTGGGGQGQGSPAPPHGGLGARPGGDRVPATGRGLCSQVRRVADREPRPRGGGWSAEPRGTPIQERALPPAPHGGLQGSPPLLTANWRGAHRRSRWLSSLGTRAPLGQGDLEGPLGQGRSAQRPDDGQGQFGTGVAGLHLRKGARGETERSYKAGPASRGMPNGGVGAGTDGSAKGM